VLDTFYKGLEYKPVDLSYSGEAPLRTKHLPSPAKLAPNPIPEPEVQTAQRHEVTLTAGMMGGSGMGGMMMGGGSMWAINGVPMPDGHMGEMEPNLDARSRQNLRPGDREQTAWHHPIYLHGHSFRVITHYGKPTKCREWRDNVPDGAARRPEIAFGADDPGDWMFHCHILDHQEGGMMSVIRVASGSPCGRPAPGSCFRPCSCRP